MKERAHEGPTSCAGTRIAWLEKQRLQDPRSHRFSRHNLAHRIATSAYRSALQVARWFAWHGSGTTGVTIGRLSDFGKHCQSSTVISFDLFDTLVVRDVDPPDLLKRMSATLAESLLGMKGLPVSRDLFQFARDQAEHELRSQSARRGLDPECRISDILFRALAGLAGEDEATEMADLLIDYELDVEQRHLTVAPDAEDLLESLQMSGKRVVVVSDTYFEGRHLKRLLAGLGLSKFIDEVYSSADFCAGKYSRRLYRIVYEKEGIEPTALVHVGDNFVSDAWGALRAGSKGVHLHDAAQRRHRRKLRKSCAASIEGRSHKMPWNIAPIRGGSDPNLAPAKLRDRELFEIGKQYVGPAFCAFVLHTIEEAYRWSARDVYYLAREGFLFSRIHALLTSKLARFSHLPLPRYHYLKVSRLSTSLPAVHRWGPNEEALLRHRTPRAVPCNVLDAFGLDPGEFEDVLSEIKTNGADGLRQLTRDDRFRSRIQDRAKAARVLLRAYLEQESFFGHGKTALLVDIGWSATIQYNLTRAFERDPDFPTLVGVYFGRHYQHGPENLISARSLCLPGLFFDARHGQGNGRAIARCVEIFEISAAAPHGTCMGYESIGDSIAPVLAESTQELSRDLEILQKGIMEHARSFAERYDNLEIPVPSLVRRANAQLTRLISRPTRRQAMSLGSLHHSADWGSTDSRLLAGEQFATSQFFLPWKFLNTVNRVYWREGALRLTRVPGAKLYYMALALMAKLAISSLGIARSILRSPVEQNPR